jgi:hypothetical protein
MDSKGGEEVKLWVGKKGEETGDEMDSSEIPTLSL